MSIIISLFKLYSLRLIAQITGGNSQKRRNLADFDRLFERDSRFLSLFIKSGNQVKVSNY
ncbi:MAG: hypothetical protein ACTTH5_04435 [Wolinella sp.]